MKQRQALVSFVGIDDEFIADRYDFWRRVLADRMEPHLDSAKVEMEHRGYAFDTLDHTSCYRREEKLGGIERVTSPGGICVEKNLCVLCSG